MKLDITPTSKIIRKDNLNIDAIETPFWEPFVKSNDYSDISLKYALFASPPLSGNNGGHVVEGTSTLRTPVNPDKDINTYIGYRDIDFFRSLEIFDNIFKDEFIWRNVI